MGLFSVSGSAKDTPTFNYIVLMTTTLISPRYFHCPARQGNKKSRSSRLGEAALKIFLLPSLALSSAGSKGLFSAAHFYMGSTPCLHFT
jgi:hypothetical protein